MKLRIETAIGPTARKPHSLKLSELQSTRAVARLQGDIAQLTVGDLGELSPYRDKITEVGIGQMRGVDHLDFLRHFPNIQKATIISSVKDISGLQSLHQLTELHLDTSSA